MGHYYAVRGPGFLVEYDNTQNDANHIHAVWRDLTNDWGEDLLGDHYRRDHTADADRNSASPPNGHQTGMELEHPSTLGRFDRTSDVHPIDEANERDAERDASRERTKDVAKEPHSLRRVQLGRSDVFLPASVVDGRVSGSSQIAHPVDLAPGSPDQPPAGDRDDRHRRGPGQAALPAAGW